MRGALGATLAALRAYRHVARATSKRRATRGQANVGAPAALSAEEFLGKPDRSQARRSVIAICVGSVLAVAALIAAVVGVLDLGAGSQPGQPRTVIEPYGAAPGATSSAALAAGTATGRAPTDPLSANSTASGAPGRPAAGGTTTVPTGSASFGSTPAATSSAAPADSTAASASPSLVDLCRSVVAAGNSWPSVLKGADRTTVIAAAGSKKNVLPYCTNLVASN